MWRIDLIIVLYLVLSTTLWTNILKRLPLGKDILVAGDLNCDMLKLRSPEANALLDLCNSVNLTQLIKEPTRVTENSSTHIDVIMTSSNNIVEDSGVVVSHISDHFLVYTSLKLKLP